MKKLFIAVLAVALSGCIMYGGEREHGREHGQTSVTVNGGYSGTHSSTGQNSSSANVGFGVKRSNQ